MEQVELKDSVAFLTDLVGRGLRIEGRQVITIDLLARQGDGGTEFFAQVIHHQKVISERTLPVGDTLTVSHAFAIEQGPLDPVLLPLEIGYMGKEYVLKATKKGGLILNKK